MTRQGWGQSLQGPPPAGALGSALPLTSWLTFVKFLSLSEPELAHLFHGDSGISRWLTAEVKCSGDRQ